MMTTWIIRKHELCCNPRCCCCAFVDSFADNSVLPHCDFGLGRAALLASLVFVLLHVDNGATAAAEQPTMIVKQYC